MKKICFDKLRFIPAGHEDDKNPGVFKKILLTYKDITEGCRIQMINWAKLPIGNSFVSHYHEDMDEIFIIVSGIVNINIDNELSVLEKGDCVFIPMRKVHKMENIGSEDVNYIVIGLSLGLNGKTKISDI